MNARDPSPEPADRLARAEEALRSSPVPEGPSEDVIARTRAALRGADERPGNAPILNPRRSPMIAILKLAAAASLALSAAALSYLATTPPAGAATTFAETAKRIQDARTLSYRISVEVPGLDGPMTGRELYKDPGLIRTEMDTPRPFVNVIDMARGKLLTLDSKAKVAVLQDWSPPDEVKRASQDWVSGMTKHLRSLAGKEGKPAGSRKIGDVQAEGFRVEDEGMTWTVWVDPARKFPLLMETTVRIQDQDVPASMSDFRIDPPLDDALFRLDPPAGYALRKFDLPIPLREQALTALLRLYAEASGGTFPPKPDDVAAFQKQFPPEKWTGPEDPQMIRLAQSMSASVVFLKFELKDAYGYAPEGIKLGDADKVLLWYRPKDSKGYRAIFGDLHAEDVSADRLPEKPKF
jgi:outer membrane lipoprotein-sorting protein